MKHESYLMLTLAVFGFVIALIYWATGLPRQYVGTTGGGTVMLAAFGLLGLVPGSYYLWWSRRMTRRAEDDPEATPASAAGSVVGVFPSSSIWPFTFGAAALLVALSLVFGFWTATLGFTLAISALIGVIVESRRGGSH